MGSAISKNTVSAVSSTSSKTVRKFPKGNKILENEIPPTSHNIYEQNNLHDQYELESKDVETSEITDVELLSQDKQAASNLKHFKMNMFERRSAQSESARKTMDRIRKAKHIRDTLEQNSSTNSTTRSTIKIEELVTLLKIRNNYISVDSRIESMKPILENWNIKSEMLPALAKYFNVPEVVGRVDPKSSTQKTIWK